MGDEPPKLTLASSNDADLEPGDGELQRERERCLNWIEWDTRELAANMLRVMRGAGRPYQLIDQVMALSNRLTGAPKGVTVGDAHEAMWTALADGLRERDDFDGGIEQIESGVVRTVAGRLVKQLTQASAGHREMFDGIITVERVRERNREEMRAVSRAMPKTRRQRARVASAIVAGKIPPMPTATQIKSVVNEPEPKPRSTAEVMRINAQRLREGKEPI